VPGYSYQWYLNGAAVSGATFSTWTFTPVSTGTYTVYLNVTDSVLKTAKSNEASVTVAPPLTVSISPTSASILVGQSVTFASTVSGGYPPYSYQWYLNGALVSGATTWTLTPTTSGIYYVYLKVTDDNNNVAQSETARITVSTVPVGGYSISLTKQTPPSHVAAYIALIALFGAILSLAKRKRK
jgi:PKD repeat protein